MKRRSIFLSVCVIAILLTGCGGTVGKFQQSTGTEVRLSENNYKLVKAGATGSSSGFYLLGLIPITKPTFAEAKSDLYQSSGHALEGRSIALANQTQDESLLYLILFSIPKITISADIVEFTDKK